MNAAKNASDVLIDYIADVEADDQVGLTIYTHNSSDGALTEIGLVSDPLTVKPFYRQRQASHYDVYTNIGAGIKEAREELVTNGRQDAVWVMVLMTDGVANRPSGYAEQYALDQADLCKTAKIKIKMAKPNNPPTTSSPPPPISTATPGRPESAGRELRLCRGILQRINSNTIYPW